MVSSTLPLTPIEEQKFTLPGYHNWQQMKTVENTLSSFPGVRLSYADGIIELMTISPEHETLKCILGILLATFFVANDINFTPTGSATLEKEPKSRLEPDLSYFFDPRSPIPNLVIEIALTSGGIKKLDKYKALQIPEVWFWENNHFIRYSWQEDHYQEINQSKQFPNLDFNQLAQCLQMPDKKEAIKTFRQAVEASK